MSNNIHITASDLKKLNYVDINGTSDDFSKNDFWYYTSMDTASKILSGQCFYVSNLDGMNDLNESDLHNEDRDRVHAICFVNSQSEKIPMWYLYSGIAGDGVSIGFTPSIMLKLIRSISTVTPVNDENKLLTVGNDIQLQCGWIYYRKKQISQVFHKNKWYTVSGADEFENSNYFIKDYGWNYEKEFRIVFINNSASRYDKLKISFDNSILRSLKIRIAPETDEAKINEFIRSDGMVNKTKAALYYSDLGIKMDLINRNKESIIQLIHSRNQNIPIEELQAAFSDNQP